MREQFNNYYMSNTGRCYGKTAMLNFHIQTVRDLQFRAICIPEDYSKNCYLLNLLPEERDQDMQGLLIHGFKLKEAFDLLKETYKF